jgi:hypothetical protein
VRIETGRDPFARKTVRKRKSLDHKTCTFCGSTGGRGYVWQYYVDADSLRDSHDIPGSFCSIRCLNAYHY